ncbi:hypothetical protein Ndes2526B_g03873 [Nannochloris sp. 'desiccata']
MNGTVQDLLAGRNKDPFAQKLVNFGNSRLVALHSLDDPNAEGWEGSGEALKRGVASSSRITAAGRNDTANKAVVEEASINVSLRVELLRSMRTTLLRKTDDALKKIEAAAASAPTSTTKRPAGGRKTTASRLQEPPSSAFNQNSESFYNQEVYDRMQAMLACSSHFASFARGGGGGSEEAPAAAALTAQDAYTTFFSAAKEDVLKQLAAPTPSTATTTAPARKKQSRCLDLQRELPAPCVQRHLHVIEETILRPSLFGKNNSTTTSTSTAAGTIPDDMAEKGGLCNKSADGCSDAIQILSRHVEALRARGVVVLQEPFTFLNIQDMSINAEEEVQEGEEGGEFQQHLAAEQHREQNGTAAGVGSFEDAFGAGGGRHDGVDHYEWPDEIMVGEKENLEEELIEEQQQQQEQLLGAGEELEEGNNKNINDNLQKQQQQNNIQPRSLPLPPFLRRAVPNFAARSRHHPGMTNTMTTPDTARDEDMEDAIEDSDNEAQIETQEETRPVLRSVVIPRRRPPQQQQQKHALIAQPLRLHTVQINQLESQDTRKDGVTGLLGENNTSVAVTGAPAARCPPRPPAAPLSLPTAPTALPRPLTTLGPRLTLLWDGPTRDPLALRPSILLNEWRGPKPRWRPQRRVEDLLLPLPRREIRGSGGNSRGGDSGGNDIGTVLNLPRMTIDSKLFTQQLLGGSGGGNGNGGIVKEGCVFPVGKTMAAAEGEEGDWNIWRQLARLLAGARAEVQGEVQVHGGTGGGGMVVGGGGFVAAVTSSDVATAAVRDVWDLLEEGVEEEKEESQHQKAKQQQQLWVDDDAWWDSEEEEENQEENNDNDSEAAVAVAAAGEEEEKEEDENECMIEVNFEDEDEEKDAGGIGAYESRLHNEKQVVEPAAVRAGQDIEMETMEIEIEIGGEAADAELAAADDGDGVDNGDGNVIATNGADSWACFDDVEEEEEAANLEEAKLAAEEDGGGGGGVATAPAQGDGFAVDVVMECDEEYDVNDNDDLLLQDYNGAGSGGLVEIDYEDQDGYNYNELMNNTKQQNIQQQLKQRQQQQQHHQLKVLQDKSNKIRESALREWHAQQKINAVGSGKLIRPALTQALIRHQQENYSKNLSNNGADTRTSMGSNKKSVLLSVLREECATALSTSSDVTAVPFVAALSALLSIVHTTNTTTTKDASIRDDAPRVQREQQREQSVIGPLRLKTTKNKQDVEISWCQVRL